MKENKKRGEVNFIALVVLVYLAIGYLILLSYDEFGGITGFASVDLQDAAPD